MSGRSSARLLLLLSAVQLTGAALAAPVTRLEITDGRAVCGGPLADGEPFHHTYIQSIYLVPVDEELELRGRGLAIRRVRSSDPRAVEYFRWPGEVVADAGGYVQDAPANEVDQLIIRITPPHGHVITGSGWSCDLAQRFGDAAVTVRAVTRPLAAAVGPR